MITAKIKLNNFKEYVYCSSDGTLKLNLQIIEANFVSQLTVIKYEQFESFGYSRGKLGEYKTPASNPNHSILGQLPSEFSETILSESCRTGYPCNTLKIANMSVK